MHGFVPPHPGPVIAIQNLHADLGVTLGLGHPSPSHDHRRRAPGAPGDGGWSSNRRAPGKAGGARRAAPVVRHHLATVLLPVVLMLGKAVLDIVIDDPDNTLQQVGDVIGNPFVALLIAVLVAMLTFGVGTGMDRGRISSTVADALPPIAGILPHRGRRRRLLAQVLVDTGIGTLLADAGPRTPTSRAAPGLVLLAVVIRLATGSATVATITASSLMVSLVAGCRPGRRPGRARGRRRLAVLLPRQRRGLLAGREYFGMTVGRPSRPGR